MSESASSTVTPPSAPSLPLGSTKSNTAAEDVPRLVTCADVPGALVVTLPMVIVAALPAGPCAPCRPRSPCSPWMPRGPCMPCAPCSPRWPCSPFSPGSPLMPLMVIGLGLSRPALFVQVKIPPESMCGTKTLTFSLKSLVVFIYVSACSASHTTSEFAYEEPPGLPTTSLRLPFALRAMTSSPSRSTGFTCSHFSSDAVLNCILALLIYFTSRRTHPKIKQ